MSVSSLMEFCIANGDRFDCVETDLITQVAPSFLEGGSQHVVRNSEMPVERGGSNVSCNI